MKLSSTTPASISFKAKSLLVLTVVLLAFAVPIQLSQRVSADKYDDQINALRQDVAKYQAEQARLNGEAKTLQNEVARLSSEKSQIQAQLDLSQLKYDKLVAEIAQTEKDIKDNQDALGTTIADLYVDDKISPLEMIASSKSVSEYLDKQEYRNSIRDELSSTITTIKTLKKNLETQKVDVERVLMDQKVQRDDLASKEAQQADLLAKTRGEEAAYQQLASQNNQAITKLQSQQAAEIASRARASGGGSFQQLPGDPNSGGYPATWRNAPMNAYVDNWGMYSRQCVSYTAWKVDQVYGNMPYWGGIGNAYQWDDNARAAGIKVNGTPAVGTVGVQNSGQYGHVGWVEVVNGDGTMIISQFNANWSGEFSRWLVPTSFFDQYIYFGG